MHSVVVQQVILMHLLSAYCLARVILWKQNWILCNLICTYSNITRIIEISKRKNQNAMNVSLGATEWRFIWITLNLYWSNRIFVDKNVKKKSWNKLFHYGVGCGCWGFFLYRIFGFKDSEKRYHRIKTEICFGFWVFLRIFSGTKTKPENIRVVSIWYLVHHRFDSGENYNFVDKYDSCC